MKFSMLTQQLTIPLYCVHLKAPWKLQKLGIIPYCLSGLMGSGLDEGDKVDITIIFKEFNGLLAQMKMSSIMSAQQLSQA